MQRLIKRWFSRRSLQTLFNSSMPFVVLTAALLSGMSNCECSRLMNNAAGCCASVGPAICCDCDYETKTPSHFSPPTKPPCSCRGETELPGVKPQLSGRQFARTSPFTELAAKAIEVLGGSEHLRRPMLCSLDRSLGRCAWLCRFLI